MSESSALSAIAARTNLAVACPRCGHLTEKPLPSLKWARNVDCEGCGNEVDVATGEIRVEIDTIFEGCLRAGV